MNAFFEKSKQINLKYGILQKVKAAFGAVGVGMRKQAMTLLPDEGSLAQSAFLLLIAESESETPEIYVDAIVALELLKAGYEIRDKLVNKSPTFSPHFFIKDKIDVNYGLLISDVLISRGLSYLYFNCDRRINNHIDLMVSDIVNSRLDIAQLLKSESLDLKKYSEIIVRNFGSVIKIGLLTIKNSSIVNPQLLTSISNLAMNYSVACEFAEDFSGFFGTAARYNNDLSRISIENTNLIYPILLLMELVSSYEAEMLKNILITLKCKGGALGHKEMWRIKVLMKKYNVIDFALRKISEHISSALSEMKILGWNESEPLVDFVNLLLKSNWSIEFINRQS
ncbi:MAG TPA: hypothetical protein PKK26_09625 [Candidatus Wallbacteria bacterium]|nr:hypothetical protein [Candidatus Wallbacteria bacterium]